MKNTLFSTRRKSAVCGIAIAVFVATFALLSVLLPSSVCEANSAMRYYEGRDVSGAILTTENSPVVVEREDLTFDIQFDEDHLNGLQIGSVSAKYTFKNPSEIIAKTNVIFPIARLGEMRGTSDLSAAYGVKIDGEQATTKIRFSYLERGKDFSVGNVKLIKDEKIDHEFYKRDTVVYKYTYSCTAQNAYCSIYLGNIDQRKIVCESGYTGYEQFYDGAARISFWTENHPYVFYSIGEEIDVAERAKFYSDYSMKDTAMGLFKLQSKQQINFEQLAFSYFDESYGVSETDWYNAVLASLDNTDTVATSYNFNILNDLFGWFEYDMTFEPGQTIINEVVAPLYPDIDDRYVPTVYRFTYLVSPASTWAGFKNLNVKINTNYYITSSQYDFEQVEGGYAWHSDTLPTSELKFSLCKSENPVARASQSKNKIESIILLTVLEPLCIAVVGLAIVIGVIKGKENKNKVVKRPLKNGSDKKGDTDGKNDDTFDEVE